MELRLSPNQSSFTEYPNHVIMLNGGALHWQVRVFNWSFWNHNTMLQIQCYLETSVGLFQLGVPDYFSDGNFRALRVNGPQSDVIIHLPDFAYICK